MILALRRNAELTVSFPHWQLSKLVFGSYNAYGKVVMVKDDVLTEIKNERQIDLLKFTKCRMLIILLDKCGAHPHWHTFSLSFLCPCRYIADRQCCLK